MSLSLMYVLLLGIAYELSVITTANVVIDIHAGD